ncbi:MAG: exodeoxyribonuclease VII large subunit [Planctomycetaceae bacterium]|nr:exodeoxyribonuclease VII large subunit [Planctomycetaceae bacterium]
MPTSPLPSSDKASATVLTVAELTFQIKEVLEGTFPKVWVTGEITDLARPRSGHVYLTLKDETSQIRAVVWKNTAASLAVKLEDGLEVIAQGDVEVYAPRGSYQLIIRQLEPRGLGALQLAFRKLHAKLSAEGLFEAEHKQKLPAWPTRVAVVTSPTGAAIRDFLEVLKRRWPGVEILVVPTRVQGQGAAGEIARAITTVSTLPSSPDILVVCRGGGSMEDLWCFNEEAVVRAIFASPVPVVSAVGHEIDVTLSDLVADVRALTPSEAAEIILPSVEQVQQQLHQLRLRMVSQLQRQVALQRSNLDGLANRRVLRQPLQQIHDLARQLDELENRTSRAWLHFRTRAEEGLRGVEGKLESLSPLQVLGRGFSLTMRTRDGQLVQTADMLEAGEQISTRLAHGKITSRVEKRVKKVESEND